MHEAQIYIEKHLKNRKKYSELGKGGVSSLNWGGLYPLEGGV